MEGCNQHSRDGGCSSTRNVASNDSLRFLENEVERLTKEVAEQCTKRMAHLLPLLRPGSDYSQPSTPIERVDSPLQTSQPAEGKPWEQNPSTSTALSDTRAVSDESFSKRKEAEKFECEPWPQASQFNSWKVSFRREVIPGSTHPRLISDWFAQIDVAASMGDFDPSRFVFDKHQMEFESLDSEVPKRNHEDSTS